MASDTGGVTALLQQWRSGDRQAEAQLFELQMPELRAIAPRCFGGERSGHTLQPTALVNEAFLQRRVVELKFSLGLTDEEAAEALNMKLRSLQREWHRAWKWLFERLRERR